MRRRELLDVRFACSSDVLLPDRFDFDNRYETVLIEGTPASFIYQRVVGDAEHVSAYLEALTGPLSIDAFGPALHLSGQ